MNNHVNDPLLYDEFMNQLRNNFDTAVFDSSWEDLFDYYLHVNGRLISRLSKMRNKKITKDVKLLLKDYASTIVALHMLIDSHAYDDMYFSPSKEEIDSAVLQAYKQVIEIHATGGDLFAE